MRQTLSVFGSPIDAVTWEEALSRIGHWTAARESCYVCFCNVHSMVAATRDQPFSDVVRKTDMATPVGAPIAWLIRRLIHLPW